MRAAIEAPGIGWLHFLWDSTQPATFAFDNRLGKIKGRIKLADGAAVPCPIVGPGATRRIIPPPRQPTRFKPGSTSAVAAGLDGSFLLDNLPPGRYFVEFDINQNLPVDAKRVDNVEVGPGCCRRRSKSRRSGSPPSPVASSTRRPARDSPTFRSTASDSTRRGTSKTRAKPEPTPNGRYSIAAAPGVVKILPAGLPKAGLVPRYSEAPELELTTDQVWPDLKLVKAVELDGIVVDETGQPVVGAEVYVLDEGPQRQDEVTRTGPGGPSISISSIPTPHYRCGLAPWSRPPTAG